jgi:hypothetical protein
MANDDSSERLQRQLDAAGPLGLRGGIAREPVANPDGDVRRRLDDVQAVGGLALDVRINNDSVRPIAENDPETLVVRLRANSQNSGRSRRRGGIPLRRMINPVAVGGSVLRRTVTRGCCGC